MSLKTLPNKVTAGISQLKTGQGMKSAAIQLGMGAAIGAIAALLLHALQIFVINKYLAAYSKIDGFTIYPNAPSNSIFVEDIILIMLSVGMIFTKKLWLGVGFIVGWYASNYMGLYTALHLPTPTS